MEVMRCSSIVPIGMSQFGMVWGNWGYKGWRLRHSKRYHDRGEYLSSPSRPCGLGRPRSIPPRTIYESRWDLYAATWVFYAILRGSPNLHGRKVGERFPVLVYVAHISEFYPHRTRGSWDANIATKIWKNYIPTISIWSVFDVRNPGVECFPPFYLDYVVTLPCYVFELRIRNRGPHQWTLKNREWI